ncbi:MAG: CDF family Co(II)/Ni(II) efflux transporter DmeF [Pseudomonadota bacterium]
MTINNCSTRKQAPQSQQNEKLTLVVVIITLITMFAEIIAGILSGSMALLSDGIHMGTHALALFITLAAYIFARRHNHNPKYSFGTGKVGVLGGYTNAILLLLAGGAMIIESIERLFNPVNILFNEAIIVAVVGLVVNIISAFILGHGNNGHGHDHRGHSHSHSNPKNIGSGSMGHENHSHGHNDHSHDNLTHNNNNPNSSRGHEDHNLKAAYLHVITDALTSVLAIIALVFAKYFGFNWADPAVGILGAIVVIRWAIGLLKQTSGLLLDKGDFSKDIDHLRTHLESDTTNLIDIHIWQISENERSLIISLETSEPNEPQFYHDIINHTGGFDHITIEVNKKNV